MTKAKCAKCGSIIESKGDCHNFVKCKCGSIFVDGGDDYSRCGCDDPKNFLIWNDKIQDYELMSFDPKPIKKKIKSNPCRKCDDYKRCVTRNYDDCNHFVEKKKK